MIARLLVTFGVVAAAVGFTFLGMSTSTFELHEQMQRVSYILMGAGVVAAVLGAFWLRASEG